MYKQQSRYNYLKFEKIGFNFFNGYMLLLVLGGLYLTLSA